MRRIRRFCERCVSAQAVNPKGAITRGPRVCNIVLVCEEIGRDTVTSTYLVVRVCEGTLPGPRPRIDGWLELDSQVSCRQVQGIRGPFSLRRGRSVCIRRTGSP